MPDARLFGCFDRADERARYLLAPDEAQRAPRPSWAYCMAIIRRCQRDGLLTLDAWRRDREEWQRKQMSNPALQYQQRDYRETDFGEDFFFDVVGEYGGVTRETT